MNRKLVASVLALFTIGVPALFVRPALGAEPDGYKPQQKQQPPAQASEGESKAAMKVEAAADTAAKLQAAAEFLKKYPKSTLRPKVAGYLATEINKTADNSQKITFFENMLTVFKEPTDADIINPVLFDAYLKADPPRAEAAFKLASDVVARDPNDLTSLTQIAILGVDQARKGNAKYVPQGLQSAEKAIKLIESGNKPANFDDARWSEYQTKWLPFLYQSAGLMTMVTGNKEESRSKLEKSASLNPSDPFTFLLLGSLANEEYQDLAEKHKNQAAGPLKDSLLDQAQRKMDQVIDLYAHAVALAEGNPPYQRLHDQILGDLETYWKYRHAGSLDGLQQLIDKYKKP
jgi:hypothetical protein